MTDQAWWDRIYLADNSPWGTEPRELVIELSKRLPPSGAVLDLGCGSGRDAWYLHNAGHRVTAVDISTEAIKAAKNSCPENVGIQFLVSDFRAFLSECLEHSFDGVLSVNALNHAGTDFFDALRSIESILRPKGVLALSVFSDVDEEFAGSREIAPHTFTTGGGIVRLVSREEITAALSNFSVEIFKQEEYLDPGHLGVSRPHKHSFFRILAVLRDQ